MTKKKAKKKPAPKKKEIVPQPMNLNTLAVEISKLEGKKVQVNIAQIKEVLRVLIDILSNDVVHADDAGTSIRNQKICILTSAAGQVWARKKAIAALKDKKK